MSVVVEPSPSKSSSAKVSFYRPELDALRFFAFFAVFMFHMPRKLSWGVPVNSLLDAGCFGVDLFFVLSAYLITELLVRERVATGKLDVRAFYIRRILRIWPLYFFFIGIAALVPWWNPGHVFGLRYVIPFLLLSGNWSIIAFGWPLKSIALPLWSVSIEEQFYLLWPIIVRRIRRDHIGWAAIAMLGVATGTRICLVAMHAPGSAAVWCNTLARLDPIAAGILLAVVLRGSTPTLGFGTRLFLLGCATVPLPFVAHVWKINAPARLDWTGTLLGYPIVALCCAAIVLAGIGIRPVPKSLIYLG